MEKVKCICVMRELFMSLTALENSLQATHGVSLNEAMVLCSLGQELVTASVVAERTGLRPSHVSKVVGALENRDLLERRLGELDKRQMHFSLTTEGRRILEQIKQKGVEVPKLLQPIFETYQPHSTPQNEA